MNGHCTEDDGVEFLDVDGLVNHTAIDTGVLTLHLSLQIALPCVRAEGVVTGEVETARCRVGYGTKHQEFLTVRDPQQVGDRVERDGAGDEVGGVITQSTAPELPRARVDDEAEAVEIGDEDAEADDVGGDGADDGATTTVHGVVLEAALDAGNLIAGGVAFHQVDPLLLVVRVFPDACRHAGRPSLVMIGVALHVVGGSSLELGQIG